MAVSACQQDQQSMWGSSMGGYIHVLDYIPIDWRRREPTAPP